MIATSFRAAVFVALVLLGSAEAQRPAPLQPPSGAPQGGVRPTNQAPPGAAPSGAAPAPRGAGQADGTPSPWERRWLRDRRTDATPGGTGKGTPQPAPGPAPADPAMLRRAAIEKAVALWRNNLPSAGDEILLGDLHHIAPGAGRAHHRIEIRRIRTPAGVRTVLGFAPGPRDPKSLVLVHENPRGSSARWSLLASGSRADSMPATTESERFLGTAFRYFDLLALDPDLFDFEDVEERDLDGETLLRLDGRVRSRGAPWDRAWTTLRRSDGRVLRVDWFASGRRAAVLTASDFELFAGRRAPSRIALVDLAEGSRSEIVVRALRMDAGLAPGDFVPGRLDSHR